MNATFWRPSKEVLPYKQRRAEEKYTPLRISRQSIFFPITRQIWLLCLHNISSVSREWNTMTLEVNAGTLKTTIA